VSPQGTLIWNIFTKSFTAKVFIEYLDMLISKEEGKIFLIMDNHPVHKANDVKEWIMEHKDRIELRFLPPYSPDFNPEELVNQDLKLHTGSYQILRTPEALVDSVSHRLTQLQDENKGGNFCDKCLSKMKT
jgi:transposase